MIQYLWRFGKLWQASAEMILADKRKKHWQNELHIAAQIQSAGRQQSDRMLIKIRQRV